jgi:DnaJ-domain-containing protein 1
MRFKRLFKKSEPADPFAVFAQTYGIRIPQDDQPPEAEPEVEPEAEPKAEPEAEPEAEPDDEPQPVELGPTRAHQVLGVRLGASWQEVGRAYRNLALVHHPDRVAGMDPESREYSEERMKEINAAYDELRRRGT